MFAPDSEMSLTNVVATHQLLRLNQSIPYPKNYGTNICMLGILKDNTVVFINPYYIISIVLQ